jgi:myo-inositol 2-dehydrogenase/D-chiro-inositol 1-dehydrogenase
MKDEETPMIGIAVLGAGRIGKIHAASVAANPKARLVAVADPFPAAVEPLAEALGAAAMSDPMAAIARPDVDAVVIGTPTDTHVGLLLKAVELGKAVLCEKPIDLDMAESEKAAAEVERVGGKVMLAFNRRFDASFAAVRREIDAGRIGEVRQVVITSRDPGMAPPAYIKTSGGIFRDMTIHDLDMARWLLGEEPVLVSAVGSRLIAPDLLGQYEDYDTAMVLLQTASGKQAHINNCREAVYGYDQRVEVLGATGMLAQDNLRPSTLRMTTAESTDAREPLLNFFLERYAQAYRSEMEAFVDALAEGKPMPTTVRDGVAALRLAECAVESARTGRAVAV